MPDVDIETLDKIRDLYTDLPKLDALYHRPDELLDLWQSSLTAFEQLVREYITRIPRS